ncbi:MAG: FemAB domain protein [Candidatus Woesebacteria bacterium GW2011_GWC2_45_9]|uniref:FemAB domain protein n=1 Tax=Candidatus Woesebacteria bacterium GW2011_GWC2_45_9 TaxID=1618589 RepID=A0A0G1NAH0_9BACT|nr:MAG: FemAB domain protein [Candidatus Woesebacteria bacterium GW2011_GWC2_45_9]
MVDIRQTVQYANYLSKIGWRVEREKEINYFIKKLPIVGSMMKIQRPEEIHINKIRELSKKYRAFQIIVEPKTDFDAKFILSLDFKLSKSPYLPTKTLQIDLTKTKEKILNGFEKDAKSAIKKGKNMEIKDFKDNLDKFRNAWKKSVGFKRYVPPLEHLASLKKSFKNDSLFLMTRDESAGAIFLSGDNITYYWQAFTGRDGRRSLAQSKIVWEGILWAKKTGARIFDFEGIYDERFPNKSWQGFTHFKKSFGGYEVAYPGTFVKWFP